MLSTWDVYAQKAPILKKIVQINDINCDIIDYTLCNAGNKNNHFA